jgi:hypothetical protein
MKWWTGITMVCNTETTRYNHEVLSAVAMYRVVHKFCIHFSGLLRCIYALSARLVVI